MFGFDIKTARIVWTAFLVALLLFVTYTVSATVFVLLFAVFFSYLIYPLVELAERWRPKRLPRVASIAGVYLVVAVVAVAAIAAFGAQVGSEAERLGEQLPAWFNAPDASQHLPLPSALEPQRAHIYAFLVDQVRGLGTAGVPLAKRLGAGALQVAGHLIYLILVPILSFMLIKDAPDLSRDFLSSLSAKNRVLWGGIVTDLDVLLSRYVRALLFLSGATLVSYGIAFSLLGVPYGLLLAAVAAVLEFIPFAGPLGAVALVLVVALFSGYDNMLWLIAFFAAYRTFQDYVLNPYLMSEGVEVSPLLVILGLLAGDQLGGVVGIFLSVPTIAAAKIVIQRVRVYRSQQTAERGHADGETRVPRPPRPPRPPRAPRPRTSSPSSKE